MNLNLSGIGIMNKQEIIDIIEPALKSKFIGKPDPAHSQRTITDVKVILEEKSEYVDGQGEYDEGYTIEYTDFRIMIKTKMNKSGKDMGWKAIWLNSY